MHLLSAGNFSDLNKNSGKLLLVQIHCKPLKSAFGESRNHTPTTNHTLLHAMRYLDKLIDCSTVASATALVASKQ